MASLRRCIPAITMDTARKQAKRLSISHGALLVAKAAHEGQLRKGTNLPYIIHPYSVYGNLRVHTDDEVTLAAAALHDVLEDVDPLVYSEQDMRDDFGDDVTSTVLLVTKDPTIKTWRESNLAYIHTLQAAGDERALLVCASDKLDNLTTSLHDYARQGETFWDRFAAGKADQIWWYNSVFTMLNGFLPNHPIVILYGQKVAMLNNL